MMYAIRKASASFTGGSIRKEIFILMMDSKVIEEILGYDIDQDGNLVFEIKWKNSWISENHIRSMINGNAKVMAQFENFYKEHHLRQKLETSAKTNGEPVVVKTEPQDNFEPHEMTLFMCDICSSTFDSHHSLQRHQQSCVTLVKFPETSGNSGSKDATSTSAYNSTSGIIYGIPNISRNCVTSIVEELRKSKAQERATLDETLPNLIDFQQPQSTSKTTQQIPPNNANVPNVLPIVINNKVFSHPSIAINGMVAKEHQNSPDLVGVFECENCNMTFADAEYLARHKVRCKNHEFSTIRCEICQRGFTTKGSRNLHVKAVHLKTKEFECNICGKQFARKHILKVHLATHSEEHEFQCAVCGKTFKQKSNLNRHERIHECKNFGYRCRFCGQAFTQNKHLKKHMSVMHPNGTVETKTEM